jgi:hypothetical protein
MMNDVPCALNTECGSCCFSVMNLLTNSDFASPEAETVMFGRSPACGPSGAMVPCFLLSGLKCTPAEVNGGSQVPKV